MISKNAKSSLSISKTVSLAVKLMHPSISCNYLKSPNYVMEHQIVTLVLTNQTLNSNAQVSNWRCYCTIMMLLPPCILRHFLGTFFTKNTLVVMSSFIWFGYNFVPSISQRWKRKNVKIIFRNKQKIKFKKCKQKTVKITNKMRALVSLSFGCIERQLQLLTNQNTRAAKHWEMSKIFNSKIKCNFIEYFFS